LRETFFGSEADKEVSQKQNARHSA